MKRYTVRRLDNKQELARFNKLESAREFAIHYINTLHIMVEIIEDWEE